MLSLYLILNPDVIAHLRRVSSGTPSDLLQPPKTEFLL